MTSGKKLRIVIWLLNKLLIQSKYKNNPDENQDFFLKI